MEEKKDMNQIGMNRSVSFAIFLIKWFNDLQKQFHFIRTQKVSNLEKKNMPQTK